jgi:hypothetical protein
MTASQNPARTQLEATRGMLLAEISAWLLAECTRLGGTVPLFTARAGFFLSLVSTTRRACSVSGSPFKLELRELRDYILAGIVLNSSSSSAAWRDLEHRLDHAWSMQSRSFTEGLGSQIPTATPQQLLLLTEFVRLTLASSPTKPRPFATSGATWNIMQLLSEAGQLLGISSLNLAFLCDALERYSGLSETRHNLCADRATPLIWMRALKEPSSSQQEKYNSDTDYRWQGLTSSLPGGQLLVEKYTSLSRRVLPQIEKAMSQLRQNNLPFAGDILAECAREQATLLAESPAIFHLIGRFWHGAASFLNYCDRRFEEAETELSLVSQSITQCVSHERAFVPVATMSLDVPKKLARIARDQERWEDMAQELERAHRMITDNDPLCTLSDGEKIFHRSILMQLGDTRHMPEVLELSVRYLADVALRERVFFGFVRRLISGVH